MQCWEWWRPWISPKWKIWCMHQWSIQWHLCMGCHYLIFAGNIACENKRMTTHAQDFIQLMFSCLWEHASHTCCVNTANLSWNVPQVTLLIFIVLAMHFPELNLKPPVRSRHVPHRHWKNIENQRALFDNIASKLSICLCVLLLTWNTSQIHRIGTTFPCIRCLSWVVEWSSTTIAVPCFEHYEQSILNTFGIHIGSKLLGTHRLGRWCIPKRSMHSFTNWSGYLQPVIWFTLEIFPEYSIEFNSHPFGTLKHPRSSIELDVSTVSLNSYEYSQVPNVTESISMLTWEPS